MEIQLILASSFLRFTFEKVFTVPNKQETGWKPELVWKFQEEMKVFLYRDSNS